MTLVLLVLLSGARVHAWDETTQGPHPFPLLDLPDTHLVVRDGIIAWDGPTDAHTLAQMAHDFWGFWTAVAPTGAWFLEQPLPVHGTPPLALRLSFLDTETRQMRCESPLPLDALAQQVLTLLGCDAQEVL